jgi:ketosteroid isomerase-like protein
MCSRLIAIGLLLATAVSPAHAVEKSRSANLRVEVQEAVKKFFAFSQNDRTSVLEMYDKTDNVISVLDGDPARGINEIRDALNSSLHVSYRWELGAIEVLPIGSHYAVSVVPYFLIQTDSLGKPTKRQGVSTLVWKKIKGKWGIIHEHESTTRP